VSVVMDGGVEHEVGAVDEAVAVDSGHSSAIIDGAVMKVFNAD
jgi:hypothetical protein